MTEAVKLATYNIHKCVGRDGRHRPERIFRVLRELDADVIGIQEFDCRRRRGRRAVTAADFEAVTGCRAVAQPTLCGAEGFHGNLLLSRLPIERVERLDLTIGSLEVRGALVADLAARQGPLRVVVTHLGLWPPARRRQAAQLLDALAPPTAGPLVMLGDFNEWLPRGGCNALLTERFGDHPAIASFPATRPIVAYDRIWVEPRDHLVELAAHDSDLARIASDHLPVCGTLKYPALSAAAE